MFPSWFIEWFFLFPIIGNQWHNLWTMSIVCWDSWWYPWAVLTATSGWARISPPSSQRPAGWGWGQDLVPRDEMEQGLGLDAFGPSWSGYILAPLTLAMSQSVNCPLAKECKFRTVSAIRQTLWRRLSEKLLTRGGMWAGWGLRWFRRLVL